MGATSPPTKSYAWAWFLGLLAVASVGLSVFMINYNLRLQLTPEKLEAAWARWKAHGPRDYRLTYTQSVNGQPAEQYVVTVRGGKVQEVLENGRPLEAGRLPHYSMDRQFAHVEKFLDMDRQPGRPKTYTKAVFDADTGALTYYVRRVYFPENQRLEMLFRKLEPPPS